MKRRLLNALAVLSLIVCIATGVLWVRSYWILDLLCNEGGLAGVSCFIKSSGGRVAIESVGPDAAWTIRGWEWRRFSLDGSDPAIPLFDYIHFRSGNSRIFFISFPYWSLMALCLILPSLRGWQMLRARKRQQENLCPTCGYDLRAHRGGDRCPECGHVARAATSASSGLL